MKRLNIFGHIPPIEKMAVMTSIVVGITLTGVKFTAYFMTNSVAIFSDAVEGFANVFGSFCVLYSLRLAHKPADALHPYGHGKAENISSGFEAGLIFAAAVVIIIRAIIVLWNGDYATQDVSGLGNSLLVITMVVNAVVGWYLVRTGNRVGSMALVTDGKHLFTDVYTSVGVCLAVFGVKWTGIRVIDPIAALAAAVYILCVARKIWLKASAELMDAQDVEDDKKIRQALDLHCGSNAQEPRICGYSRVRHRHVGRYHRVDCHIQLPSEMTVKNSHKIASAIEFWIEAALVECNATAHIEPCPHCALVCGEHPPIE